MTFTDHICKARAAALVHCPDIIAELVLAYERAHLGGYRSAEHLREAERLLMDVLTDVRTAMAAKQSTGVVMSTQTALEVFGKRVFGESS